MWLLALFSATLSFASTDAVNIAPYNKCMSGIMGALDNKELSQLKDEKYIAYNADMEARHRVYRYYGNRVEECDNSNMKTWTYDDLSVPDGKQKRCKTPVSMKTARQAAREVIVAYLGKLAEAAKQNAHPISATVGAVVNQCAELEEGALNSGLSAVRQAYGIRFEQEVNLGGKAAS